jgi:hypothetical protein
MRIVVEKLKVKRGTSEMIINNRKVRPTSIITKDGWVIATCDILMARHSQHPIEEEIHIELKSDVEMDIMLTNKTVFSLSALANIKAMNLSPETPPPTAMDFASSLITSVIDLRSHTHKGR